MVNRKTHWDKVYDNKSPLEVSWYQKEPRVSLQLIKDTGIGRDAPIIDVGGGASLLVDYLLKAEYQNLTVLDISASALDYARQRLGGDAESIEWLEEDVTCFQPPRSYALWHDRAVFHFLLKEDDRRRYVAAMQRALMPGGHFIVAAFSSDGPKQCSGLDIVPYDRKSLQAALGDEFHLIESTREIHHTPSGGDQKFGYYRFIWQGGENAS